MRLQIVRLDKKQSLNTYYENQKNSYYLGFEK